MKKVLLIYGGVSPEHDVSCKYAKEIIETLSEVNFCDKAIKYIASRNLQFRQVVKIIAKSEQLAQTNKLTEITEEIIKGVIDEE